LLKQDCSEASESTKKSDQE
jgi:hypothetical protein